MPSLPAAATSTTPRCCAYRAARADRLDDRLLLLVVAAVEEPRIGEEAHVHDVELLVTGVGERVDHGVGEEVPCSVPALSATIFAFGATPAIPMPLIGAAIVPAVCVPWPA